MSSSDESMKSQMEQMVDSYDSYMRKITLGRERALREMTVNLAQVKPGDCVLETNRLGLDTQAVVRGSICQKLLHESEHLAARMGDVLGHQPQLRICQRLSTVTEQLGAHLHAAQMVLQIVSEDTQQLIFVFGELH